MSDTQIIDRSVTLTPPPAQGLINTLDPPRFAGACATLMQQVLTRYRPSLIVGVRTGGLVVAEAMARSIAEAIPVMPLTCRRSSTVAKSRLRVLPAVLAALPQPIVDRLRWTEHRLLSAHRSRNAKAPQQIDQAEADAIGRHLANGSAAPRVLVVDDAVDSGITLATVLRLLQQVAPPVTEFRSAVVTVTCEQPIAQPDFVLYHGVLCRFPWSFDAAG